MNKGKDENRMASALESYLQQIGLVSDMLLPSSKPPLSDDAAAREDAVAREQLQQRPTISTSDASFSASTPKPAANGILIPINPVTTASSGSGLSDLGPVSATVVTANSLSADEPNYVHSTRTPAWTTAESTSRAVLVGDAVANGHQNGIITVTVCSYPNSLETKSSHQDPNTTQVSHVTSKLSSAPDTRQTLVPCSANHCSLSHNLGLPRVNNQTDNPTSYYSLSNNVSQATSQAWDIPTTTYLVTQSVHSDPSPLAVVHSQAGSNSPNSTDIIQHIQTNDKLCPVDVGDVDSRSIESSGIIECDLPGDNTLVISIQESVNDILYFNQLPFNQSRFNHPSQSTTFTFEDNRSNTLSDSNHHLPAEDAADSIKKECDACYDAALGFPDQSPALSQSSNSPFHSESSGDPPGVTNVEASKSQASVIKSSLKKASPKGVRKFVTFSASDLVHIEEYTVSPATPPHNLFLPFDRQLENISEETKSSSLFGGDSSAEIWPSEIQENCQGLWFDSSTDSEPYLVDFPSPTDEIKDYGPVSFVNDVFGRTTICVTSGTFRPGESGKLNGKTVSDLSGSHDHRRTLSAGTLSGIRSHRTFVKVNFIQGLLDINHNPGQTDEADSKAVLDNGSFISTLKYCGGMFQENLKNSGIEEFPRKEIAAQKAVDQKLCHKLSRYKYRLIAAILSVFILLSLAIALGVSLYHGDST